RSDRARFDQRADGNRSHHILLRTARPPARRPKKRRFALSSEMAALPVQRQVQILAAAIVGCIRAARTVRRDATVDQVTANRLGEAECTTMRNDLKKLRGSFMPLYYDATRKCPAWYAMDPRARAIVVEIKLRFDRAVESAVSMSVRQAAKLLNTTDFHIATRMLKQAVHYGFLVKTTDGYLGPNGKGVAAQYRLTDEPYLGQPATLDFKRWDGTLFEEKPRSKKTEPRGAKHNRDFEKARKNGKSENQNPVVPDTTFLRSSPSSTASEPVAASRGEPVPAEPAPFGIERSHGRR